MAWAPGQDPTADQEVQNAKRGTEDQLIEALARRLAESVRVQSIGRAVRNPTPGLSIRRGSW
jgi:hypothetical protein